MAVIEKTEPGDILLEMHEAYSLGKAPGPRQYDTAVILCADARVPVSALSGGSMYALENAGNLYDTQKGAFPPGISHVVVAGHASTRGSGCGACAEANALSQKSWEDIENLRKGYPELYRVAASAKPTPEENLIEQLSVVRKMGYDAAGLMVNNVSCELTGLFGFDGPLREIKGLIFAANENYRQKLHPAVLEKNGGGLAGAQNPEVISISTHPLSLSEIVGGRFMQSNTVFEAKQSISGLSDLTVGTGQYAWLHALGRGTSFKNTLYTVLVAETPQALTAMAARLENDTALQGYMGRGGFVRGMVYDYQSIQFYSIKWQ